MKDIKHAVNRDTCKCTSSIVIYTRTTSMVSRYRKSFRRSLFVFELGHLNLLHTTHSNSNIFFYMVEQFRTGRFKSQIDSVWCRHFVESNFPPALKKTFLLLSRAAIHLVYILACITMTVRTSVYIQCTRNNLIDEFI